MSKLVENNSRVRDDSQVRALALGSKACREINLAAVDVDWDRFLESVAQEYKHGRTESEIDWKTTVSICAVQTASSSKESWLAGLSELFTLKRLPTLAFRLAVVGIVAWLIFFGAGKNTNETTPEFRALQQETRTLKEENARLQSEVEEARSSSEKARQELASQQKDLEQKIVQLARGNTVAATDPLTNRKSASRGEQVALSEPVPGLLSELEATGHVTPTEDTRAARQILDSRDERETLRSARSEQKPIPLSPRFTAIRLTTPTLRWEPVPAAQQYQVRVVYQDQKSNDKLVWESGPVRQTQATLPSGRLRRGGVYFWQVEALVDGKPRLSPTVGFWVISEGALRKVKSTEIRNKNSELVLTAMYETHGLYEEALMQVEKLSPKNKNMADLAQDIRRRLQVQLEKD